MSKPPEQFKKGPKRTTAKGKRVFMSPDAKATYEAMIREADEKEKMTRHLPADLQRRR